MKFCLINNLYKPYARGGAERVVEIIAEGLIKRGHESLVVSTRPYFDNKQIVGSGVKTVTLPSLYHNLEKLPLWVRFLWHLWDEVDLVNFVKVFFILWKQKPELVITHNLKGISLLIPLAIKILRIKHVHSLHDIQLLHPSGLMNYGDEKIVETKEAKIYARINAFLFGSPDVIVSPSEWLLKMHIERGLFSKSKTTVLHNPIPVGENIEIILKDKEIFRFLYVGQVEAHKGVSLIMEVFNKFPFDFLKRIDLVIVGEGSLLPEIKKSENKPANTRILGKLDRKEIFEIMVSSDCLIVPSLCYENSPTVIYEAMSAGLPVIGSDIGGIPELLDNNKALLFKPEAFELSRKIEWAVNNRQVLLDNFTMVREKMKRESVDGYIEKIAALLG